MTPGSPHTPVLRDAVLEALAPRDGEVHVDCTFGAGGYSTAMLEAAGVRVFGIDRDGASLAEAQPLVDRYAQRLTLCHGRFGEIEALLAAHGVSAVDGIVFDLGVSSMQLDRAERGFSFLRDGPLDMRMGGAAEAGTPSAADVVNTAPAEDLARIFYRYGEERRSRALAREIDKRRAEAPITRTGALAALAESVLGRPRKGDIHPATRMFQALRIHVNRELHELVTALLAAERLLKAGGRLVVVSFHSLEDRIVKTFLNARSGKAAKGSRHMPVAPDAERAPSFRLISRGVRTADARETADNPRARSAKLRAAVRLEAPAWPEDWDAYGLVGEV